MKKEKLIQEIIYQKCCFDLQFRRDVRRERLNSPTYYRWKAQFIITVPKKEIKFLKMIKKEVGCGLIHIVQTQARFSVQNIEDVSNNIVPFLNKLNFSGAKKRDFQLWQKAVGIIYANKRKNNLKWSKNDLLSLIEIQKSSAKHKNNPKNPKWIKMARSIVESL